MTEIITPSYTLVNDDCLIAMDRMEENSVDSIITDPPYDLKPNKNASGGFMGQKWDATGIAFDPETWKKCLRIAKPGCYLLAFGSDRTFHRLACAIEDAGWEIKNTVCWLYSSGMPKGINISKAIDKQRGLAREVIGTKAGLPGYSNKENVNEGRSVYGDFNDAVAECEITEPADEVSKQWNGWNSTIKPAWEPVVVAMKPLIGTYADNALLHGVAGFNIDDNRLSYKSDVDKESATPQGKCTSKDSGSIGATPDAGRNCDRVEFVRPETSGRYPTNVLLTHHEECVLNGSRKVKGTKPHQVFSNVESYSGWGTITQKHGEVVNKYEDAEGNEQIENWECHPDCPIYLLDTQTGELKSGSNCFKKKSAKGYKRHALGTESRKYGEEMISYGDRGGASRFFYNGKASKSERNLGLPKGMVNHHPTVKPLRLLEYLCNLTSTPTKGVVFDPFMGSGSMGMAALACGRKYYGIELQKEFFEISSHRVAFIQNKSKRQPKDIFEDD